MKTKKLILGFIILLIINVDYAGGQTEAPETKNQGYKEAAEHKIIIPPMKLVGPDAVKLWEGMINKRSTAYFQSKKDRKVMDIIVATQDNLPKYFKRIEYLDSDRDGNLDLLKMEIYEMGRGWRYVGISRENKYGLEYANSHYKDLMEKIKAAGGWKP